MRNALAALLLMIALPALAEPVPELKLLSEHPVEGMRGGNLSGLAMCGESLWTVSDRDDDVLYRLDTSGHVWQAESRHLDVPTPPQNGLPVGLTLTRWAASFVRGGVLDFEGVSCDAAGNRYLVSEGYAAILKVPVAGSPSWLKITPNLIREARARGLLLHFNALFEGLAVSPEGDRIWLAAERQNRGLLLIQRQQTVWDCNGACVLSSEGGMQMPPAEVPNAQPVPRDFADLSLFDGKLFTLERNAYQICRRDPLTTAVERCWSFAAEALVDNRRYSESYGMAEALVVDAQGAWIGLDNNDKARADGEARPIVWRFAAPDGGWSAQP